MKPRYYQCHVCDGGTGNSTCFSCILGLTGETSSKRHKRLVALGVITEDQVNTMEETPNDPA